MSTPMSQGNQPDIDSSTMELTAKHANYFPGLIGVLHWISCELVGWIDILVNIAMLLH